MTHIDLVKKINCLNQNTFSSQNASMNKNRCSLRYFFKHLKQRCSYLWACYIQQFLPSLHFPCSSGLEEAEQVVNHLGYTFIFHIVLTTACRVMLHNFIRWHCKTEFDRSVMGQMAEQLQNRSPTKSSIWEPAEFLVCWFSVFIWCIWEEPQPPNWLISRRKKKRIGHYTFINYFQTIISILNLFYSSGHKAEVFLTSPLL